MSLPMRKLLYRHIMTVMRLEESQNDDLSTSQSWQPVVINAPCMLSAVTSDTPKDLTEQENPVVEVYKLFCDPEVDIHPGDLIRINGWSYLAGQSFLYRDHQEMLVSRKDLAQ